MSTTARIPSSFNTESGIDVRSLELDPADLVMLDILRRPEVVLDPCSIACQCRSGRIIQYLLAAEFRRSWR